MAEKMVIQELALIENGRGDEFAFLDNIIRNRRPDRSRPARIMRFLRYHSDYIAYKDIRYLSFKGINGSLEIQIPIGEKGNMAIVIPRSTLTALRIEYRTTYLPDKYQDKRRG